MGAKCARKTLSGRTEGRGTCAAKAVARAIRKIAEMETFQLLSGAQETRRIQLRRRANFNRERD